MGLCQFVSLLRSDLRRLRSPADPNPGFLRRVLSVFNPRFLPVLNVRLARWATDSWITRPLALVPMFANLVLFGLEVTPRCRIGPGLFLPHTSGTVLGAAEIGANVTIFHGVTLGAKFADLGFDASKRPTIGNNVLIGAGAKVLGGIRVGDDVVIAANSLVLEDVPSGAVMIGVPAIAKKSGG